jgi:uncharacterized membrane protein
MDGRYYPYMEHGGTHLVGWLIFAVLLALLALAVVYAVTRTGVGARPRPALGPPAHPEDPLAVLRLRYARGELTREEYLRTSEDLGVPPPTSPAA